MSRVDQLPLLGRDARDHYESILINSSEIDERVLATRELRERDAWLAGQRAALKAAVNGASLETSLGALVDTVIDVLGKDKRAAFFLANDDVTALYHIVGMSEHYAEAVDGFKIGPDSLTCGLATATGKAILTTDVRDDPLWKQWLWLAEQFEYRACWSFPIRTAAGKFVGTLAIYSRQPCEATNRDEELGAFLADTAAIIISQHQESTQRKQAEESLRGSHETFRQLVENSPFGIYVVDADFRLSMVSAGAQEVFKNVRPLLGNDFAGVLRAVWPEPAASEFISIFRHTLATGEPYRSPYTIEQRTDSGNTEAYDWRIERIVLPGDRYGVVCHFYDLTERQHWEAALRKSERRLADELTGMTRLHELSLRLMQQQDLGEVMRDVMQAAAELLGAECSTAQLLDRQDQSLRLTAIAGFDDDFADRFQVVTLDGFTTCAGVLGSQERVIVEDLASSPEFAELAALAFPLGIRAVMSEPLLTSGGELLGVFTTYWKRPHRPTDHQLRLLDLYAQLAARQVERRAAEQTLRASEEQLQAELADTQLLQRASAAMMHQENVGTVYDQIVGAAVGLMRSDFASLQMLYPERGKGGELKLLASQGFTPEAKKLWEWVGADANSSCGRGLRAGKRWMSTDIENCESMAQAGDQTVYLQAGIYAVQSTPLVSRRGSLIGMISTHWREPHQPSEGDLRRLDILARQAADLIERTKSEQDLRESEDRFRRLVEGSPFGIYIVNSRLRIVHMNARSQSGAFRNVQPVIGRDLAEVQRILWPEEVAQQIIDKFHHTLETGEPYSSKDFINQRADSDSVEGYEWELQRISLPGNEFGVVCYYFDSSELRRAQEALRDADRRKDEFIATLAHELRNPLAPIRTGLALLKPSTGDPQMLEEIRSVMERQTLQLITLVDDLLDVSRITRGRLELRRSHVSVAEVVRSAVEASRSLVDEVGHRLTVTLPDEPISLNADPHRLAQVLSNLLTNAARYTPSGGAIDLTCTIEGSEVLIGVRDTGVGISPDMQQRVFEMFDQGGRSQSNGHIGLGIGLTLVKQLIEMHEGSVEVESEGAGRGSEFRVRLPLGVGEMPSEEGSSTEELPSDMGLRVLVVDDNRGAAHLMSVLCQKFGNDVRTACNGREAVEVAAEFRPQVVLMDINMPVMDGCEAARCIRAEPWGTAVTLVAVTGNGQETDRRRSAEAGFDQHLLKPADATTLQRLLTKVACGK